MPGFTYTVQQTSPGVFTNCCCGCMRAPLVINPWVPDASNHGRPVHGSGGRMRFVDFASTATTDFATAVSTAASAAATSANPAISRLQYSSQYITFRNPIHVIPNCFPSGAQYTDNTRFMEYRLAYEYPHVFDATYVYAGGIYCDGLLYAGATVSDGKLYFLAQSEVDKDVAYVVKLEPALSPTPQYVGVNNCTNYPSVAGYFPAAYGSYIASIAAERIMSIPGPTWQYATGTAKQLCSADYIGDVLHQQALGPVLLPADPNYNSVAFWDAVYAAAIANGTLKPTGYFSIRSNLPIVVGEWAEKNCEVMRTPLVINPWVGDATNNGRPIHAFGGRMLYTDEFGNTNTNYAAVVAANTASSPATGLYAGRYSSTYVAFNNALNLVSNRFPGGATYSNNTQKMTIRHAYQYPDVFDARFSLSYPDNTQFCGSVKINGGVVGDGKLYYVADSGDVGVPRNYVVKLVAYDPNGTAQYIPVNNCINYPSAGGNFPNVLGSYLTTIYSERILSVPGPTWSYATGTAKQLCSLVYAGVGLTIRQQPLGPLLLPADPNYNNTAFWEAAYDAAIANGTLQAGLIGRGSNVTVTEWAEK